MEEMLRQNKEKSNTLDKKPNPKTPETPETSKPRDPLTETVSSLNLGDTETREQTQARIAGLERARKDARVKNDSLDRRIQEDREESGIINIDQDKVVTARDSKEVEDALYRVYTDNLRLEDWGRRPTPEQVGESAKSSSVKDSAFRLMGVTKGYAPSDPEETTQQFNEVRGWAEKNRPGLVKGLDKYDKEVLRPMIKVGAQEKAEKEYNARSGKLYDTIQSYTEAIEKAKKKLEGGEGNKGKEGEPANKGNGSVTKNETTANINLNAMGLPEKFLDAFGSIVVQEVRRQIISSKENPVAFNAGVIPRETANA